jgi:hypothetical protein
MAIYPQEATLPIGYRISFMTCILT